MPDRPKKIGRYEITRELGKGAMGVVYEGLDPTIGRRVAIKTARRDVMEASGLAEEMMARFVREGQAAGMLNHPNIITIYDAGEEEGMAWIAMEYLPRDLRALLENRRTLAVEQIADIGAQICEALAVAHDNGVIHRDIKPANILLPTSGPLKVADFGIARTANSTLTQEGALIGTPHYMSPEQFMGQRLDGRSDLFSVAVMLYELVTGEKPFTGEALSTVMHHVIKTPPARPSELNVLVPPALDEVLIKALAKRPAERYVDGRAMAAALRESVKENPDPLILAGTPSASTMLGGTVPASETVMAAAHALPDSETLPSQARPPALDEANRTAQVPSRGTRSTRSIRITLIAGAVAVAFVLLAVFGLLLYPGGAGKTGESANAGAASIATQQVLFRVAGIHDAGQYLELSQLLEDFRAGLARGDTDAAKERYEQAVSQLDPEVGGFIQARLEITGKSGNLVQAVDVPARGTLVDLPLDVGELKVSATAEGYANASDTILSHDGRWASPQYFMLVRD